MIPVSAEAQSNIMLIEINVNVDKSYVIYLTSVLYLRLFFHALRGTNFHLMYYKAVFLN